MFVLLAEMAMKARKEISDFISLNKFDRARIRVSFWKHKFYHTHCISSFFQVDPITSEIGLNPLIFWDIHIQNKPPFQIAGILASYQISPHFSNKPLSQICPLETSNICKSSQIDPNDEQGCVPRLPLCFPQEWKITTLAQNIVKT